MKYRRRRGSLHLGMRVEHGIGLLCALLANQNRDPQKRPQPYRPEDFTDHHDDPRDTLVEALASWS